MAKTADIISSGVSPQAALNIQSGNYSQGPLVATGSTQATALLTAAAKNYVGTTAASTGVAFPGGTQQGDDLYYYNGGANALLVYTNPNTSDTINALSAGTGFSVPAGKGCLFSKVTGTVWATNLGA